MNKKTVLDFVNAINEHRVDKICFLMSDDHKFVDSHGNEAEGKDIMKMGWIGYFQLFPDYKIEITDIFDKGNTLAAYGFASGTYKGLQTENNENYWRLPAAWKVIVEHNKIKVWQVYADSKIPFDVIEKNNTDNTNNLV